MLRRLYAAALSFLHAAKAWRISIRRRSAPNYAGLRSRARCSARFPSVATAGLQYDLETYRVKPQSAVQEPWDYLSRIATVPAAPASAGQACGKS